MVRPLSQCRQTIWGIQFWYVRFRSVHPHEFSRRSGRACLYARARSRAFHAHSTLSRGSALPVCGIYYFCCRSGQHVQRTVAHPIASRRATTPKEHAAILVREIDSIRSTIIRQTMFAEFERTSHASAEAGEPLTLERIRGLYRELLNAYFDRGLRSTHHSNWNASGFHTFTMLSMSTNMPPASQPPSRWRNK